jgi:F-type H+-transporting ATPase subunit gamma
MNSVQKTMKITNAMYLMASSKLKKARAKLAATEPYFERLQYVMVDLMRHTDEGRQRYFATDREIPEHEVKYACVIITSDKGLAGAYNLNVCRMAEEFLQKVQGNTQKSKLCFIGSTGRNYFLKRPELGDVVEEQSYSAVDPYLWRARSISEYLMNEFLSGNVDHVMVFYTKMKSALVAEPESLQLLPFTPDMFPVEPEADSRSYVTEYAPSPLEVMNQVAPNYMKGLLYGAMVEAFASEQNARMTAMQNATDNAGEIVRALSLEYNRVRQAAITTELTEVVAGSNAQEQ